MIQSLRHCWASAGCLHSRTYNHADRYLGGWSDAGKLHLDVSRNFPSSRREQAISAGRRQNQIAVFDLDTFTEIPTGGTGA